ncbi:hypothetical protein GCM10018773_57050 [Streptomyces candidus]|nr:hypothetical protein GCM10018773_57050 [Streptomyces candidus]
MRVAGVAVPGGTPCSSSVSVPAVLPPSVIMVSLSGSCAAAVTGSSVCRGSHGWWHGPPRGARAPRDSFLYTASHVFAVAGEAAGDFRAA